MTVKIVEGDMVSHIGSKEHFDAYAHQANCFCRMRRGIAPLLAKIVPGIEEADNNTIAGDRGKLGTFTSAKHENGATVYNLYGQYHWSYFKVAPNRNTDYDALIKGFKAIRQNMLANNQNTLGLPFIGCGLAGGDWNNVVLPMIKHLFDNSEIEVTIFEYKE